jgi:hypothetical protein
VYTELQTLPIFVVGRTLLRRQRSSSSALPFLAEQQLRLTVLGEAAAPPYLNLGNKKAPDGSGALMKTN